MKKFFAGVWGLAVFSVIAVIAFVLIQGGAFFDSVGLRLVFVGGPVSILILLFGLRIWLPVWLPTITLSLAALAAALLGGEMVLLSQAQVVWGMPDVVNSRAQAIVELRAQGANAQANLFPKGMVDRNAAGVLHSEISIGGVKVLPLTGISQASVLMCRGGNLEWQVFNSDQYGFPNPPENWAAPAVPMAGLGDSHVQGWCVPPDQSFMGMTQENFPGTINVGTAGNGPLTNLATLREYISPLRPQTVLWMHTGANDLNDLDRESNTPVLMGYLDHEFYQGLAGLQPQIDAALIEFSKDALETAIQGGRTIDYREALRRFFTLYDLRQLIGVDKGAISDPNFGLLARVLTAANEDISAWGGTMIFVYLPTPRDARSEENSDRIGILNAAKAQGLAVIDLTQSFQDSNDPVSLFQAGEGVHYSPAGHALVAAGILRGLSQ